MNKKYLMTYLLVGALACYIFYAYGPYAKTNNAIDSADVTLANPEQGAAELLGDEAVGVKANNEELINSYTSKIDASPTDAESYYKRGLVYQSMAQYNLAIKDFTQALEIMPKSHNALYARSLAYQKENMTDKAIADLNTAITEDPNFVAAYNTRGIIYNGQGNTKDAIADYNKALAIDPTFYQASFNLGILYQQQKQYPEAKAAFNDAIAHNKPITTATKQDLINSKADLYKAHMHRSIVELESKDFNAAMEDVNFVISNDPKNVEAFRLRSQIYQELNNPADSAADAATADSLSMENLLNANKQ
jgi:Putative Zn-dependent protease, contains TPR repeats